MLVSGLLVIVGFSLQLIALVLTPLRWAFPEGVTNAFSWLFDNLHEIDILFPTETLILVLIAFLQFLFWFYLAKIIMWLYHLVRHGGSAKFPGIKTHKK